MDIPSNWYLKTARLEDGACGGCGFCPFCSMISFKKSLKGSYPMHGFYASSIGSLADKVTVSAT